MGRLGNLGSANIGDDELPTETVDIVLRSAALSISAGQSYTCALLENGDVQCWGENIYGQLGLGHDRIVGDTETPDSAGLVGLVKPAIAITSGQNHNCAILESGDVQCWGRNFAGQLGYANTKNLGDDESPRIEGLVNLGGKALMLTAGNHHTCALLVSGQVKCWGLGVGGRLGYGNSETIGDDETPGDMGAIELGGLATSIAAGALYTCALMESGTIRCWGTGQNGRLGYGHTNNIGVTEVPSSVVALDFGRHVISLSAGTEHSCVLLEDLSLSCWGRGQYGQLGYGNISNVGDTQPATNAGPISLGGQVSEIVVGGNHSCAILESGKLRCWGNNSHGQLGYGHTENIGDNQTPASAGDVVYE